MPRTRMQHGEEEASASSNYFANPAEGVEFFHTGCRLLDRVLGGGWAIGRIANVVGDRSTGKTLLAMEAIANFARKFKKGQIYYRDAEAAFDESYAEALGIPIERIDFGDERLETAEDFHRDIQDIISRSKGNEPIFYGLDSLDSLSDDREMKRKIGEGDYNTGKAIELSEIFRKYNSPLHEKRVFLMIVSQVRKRIGITFGQSNYRSGGVALDFYASQIVWLHKLKELKRQRGQIERIYGVTIKAKCTKNKVGLPFRECEFDLEFGYGINDLIACVDWLSSTGRSDYFSKMSRASFVKNFQTLEGFDYRQAVRDLHEEVDKIWGDIEIDFLPAKRKYA